MDTAVLGKGRLREVYYAILNGDAGYSAIDAHLVWATKLLKPSSFCQLACMNRSQSKTWPRRWV